MPARGPFTMSLDKNYTIDEAAAWLRMSRRAFQAVLRRHPFYFVAGRRKLFSEANLHALRAALEEDEREKACRSSPARRGRVEPHFGRSAAHISASTLTAAQVLLK